MTVATIVPVCPQASLAVSLDVTDPVEIPAAGRGVRVPRSLPFDDSGSCGGESEPSWLVDWEELSIGPNELVVARYTIPVSELEAQFAAREALAAERFTLGVSGTSADLADATSAPGDRFDGFDGEGVWLIELRKNSWFEGSVPLSVTVVEAQDP